MQQLQPRKIIRQWLGISDTEADVQFLADSRISGQPFTFQWNPQELIRESQKAWRENHSPGASYPSQLSM